jgi:hypothetical protein
MTINGLDISTYQEYEGRWVNGVFKLTLVPIDWPLLMTDPRQFKFCFSKAAHGTAVTTDPDAYPIADYIRQSNGSASVSLPYAPYHYWYYSINGVKIKGADQAKAFYKVMKDNGLLGFTIPHPMLDIEDTSIMPYVEPKNWTTEEANECLANARVAIADLKIYADQTAQLFGQSPTLYWGKWWWDRVVAQVRYYYPKELEWAKTYPTLSADYYPPLDDVPEWDEFMWQTGSTPNPGILGIGAYGGTKVDMDQWVKSES